MPALKRQLMVESLASSRGPGSSDSANLQKMFPGSPIYQGELTDDVATDAYMDEVTAGEISDDGHTFGTVNLDYQDAPNLAEVVVGGGGLPGSPYGPNIAVPLLGQNPADIPPAGVEATANAATPGHAPFSGDGLASPHDTSAVISRQTVGSLKPGDSTPTG